MCWRKSVTCADYPVALRAVLRSTIPPKPIFVNIDFMFIYAGASHRLAPAGEMSEIFCASIFSYFPD